MGVKWTEEQKDAIETTDKGVIVSAAAGSGKTAVLIERTIRLLCDESKNISADRLLAVTFTKDATNQMKTKLSAALEKKLEESPDNAWIQQQQDNLTLAKINTINAFCLDIVKSNIHEFEFQSGIKILDEVESEVILNQAIDDAFEYFYENSPQVMNFLIDRLTDNSEYSLKQIMRDIYFFLRSLPFPEKWCDEVINSLRSENCTERYVDIVAENYSNSMSKAKKNCEYAEYIMGKLKKCSDKYRDMFDDDRLKITKLCEAVESKDWEQIYNAFISCSFMRKVALKAADDEDKPIQNGYIDTLSELRDKYKWLVGDI